MYTPPTRRDSTVSSRRRRRCVLGLSGCYNFPCRLGAIDLIALPERPRTRDGNQTELELYFSLKRNEPKLFARQNQIEPELFTTDLIFTNTHTVLCNKVHALYCFYIQYFTADKINKKLSCCWETVRRESMPRIAEMDVEMTT